MARHQYIIRVIIDGPFGLEPSQTLGVIKSALPGSEVTLEHKLMPWP